MKITTVSVSYSRKFNLGNYESLELSSSFWAQVEDGEDADGVTQFLYHQAKESVKLAAMPVLKTSEFQMSKAKFNNAEDHQSNHVLQLKTDGAKSKSWNFTPLKI